MNFVFVVYMHVLMYVWVRSIDRVANYKHIRWLMQIWKMVVYTVNNFLNTKIYEI